MEVFDGKQTNWEGLWWHPEYCGYSSAAFNLAKLKQFKGTVRLYVRKNKFYNGGEGGRPNYNFCIKASNSDSFIELETEEEKRTRPYMEDGVYYDENGNRLYTYDEVERALNSAYADGAGNDGAYGDVILGDYL